MENEEKKVVVPTIDVDHRDDDSGLRINVNLAGASKDSLNLEMGQDGFCIKAEADDFRYHTCYMLAHKIKSEEAKAKFDSGLLTVHVPFEESMRSHRVPIE